MTSGTSTFSLIREIRSFDKFESFINCLAEDPLYSDPHFAHSRNNLYGSVNKKDEYAFAVEENGITEGIFVWLVIPEERFIEMIIGFTKEEKIFSEMLAYMEEKYPGCQLDIVFNPLNLAISPPLKKRGAAFDPVQQKMILTGCAPDASDSRIVLLSGEWEKQYCDLHRTDTYWTAERVLAAQDRFRVLLAVEDGQVLGYLDVTHCFDENEIYDLYVRPEASEQRYELALLGKAIELNRPHGMIVLVDADSKAETDLYAAAGFTKAPGPDTILAQLNKA